MGNVQIRWDMDGFREIRTSPEVQAALRAEADRVAASANGALREDGYFVQESADGRRARAVVVTGTVEAIRNESRNGSALSALGAGGA